MSYPTYAPSSRAFDPGNWPVKSYSSMNGTEIRLLYGSRRTAATFTLSYQNLSDVEAQEFLTHYDEMLGTFSTFDLPTSVFKGWSGDASAFDPTNSMSFRYQEAPKLDSVKPGVSSVSVSLIGVLS